MNALIELTFLRWNCRGYIDRVVLDDPTKIPLKVEPELSLGISHSEFLAIARCATEPRRLESAFEFLDFLVRGIINEDFPIAPEKIRSQGKWCLHTVRNDIGKQPSNATSKFTSLLLRTEEPRN